MPLLFEHHDLGRLDDRLHDAHAVTADLMSEIIHETCRRHPPTQIERLIRSGAWTDAGLALIELELPQWKLRRLVYDQGEWHCALSRERELPEWLDQSIETRHTDLPLAILRAFVIARRSTVPAGKTSVPAVTRSLSPFYEPVCCENFG
jgi:hypothetical protein